MVGRGRLYRDTRQWGCYRKPSPHALPTSSKACPPPASEGAETCPPVVSPSFWRWLHPLRPPCSPAPQGGLQHCGDATGKEAACQQLAGGLGWLLRQGGQQ